jgi:hypothetical protein
MGPGVGLLGVFIGAANIAESRDAHIWSEGQQSNASEKESGFR